MRRFILVAVCLMSPVVQARILFVPDSVPTIQAGIDASASGDTVVAEVNRYYENINFHGKNVAVGSRFILDGNLVWVQKTVLDGSQPANPDTASCVRIVSGEDSTCQLVGFTITGGTGTKWQDEHGAGLYREGGGILIQGSSPVISHNIIERNQATDKQGCASAGGGGMRIGDGNPAIVHNVIDNNLGRYGAGIVLNYTGATIRNTIVAYNRGGEDYGGAGIWAYADGPAAKLIENCAVAGNRCTLSVGGGMRFWSTSGTVRNCIIWGNTAQSGAQIHPTSGNPVVTYSDVQGGRAGTGNLDVDPDWSLGELMLHATSPCIDSGDPDTIYYDPDSAGVARWPALGTRRNDMGAYGGPLAAELGASLSGPVEEVPAVQPGLALAVLPALSSGPVRLLLPGRPGTLCIYDATGRPVRTFRLRSGTHEVVWDRSGDDGRRVPAGSYFCRHEGGPAAALARTILLE
jgi:hypothetical protein